ncbi:MAG: Lrp/AsnC family transcriptional regulator [Candidatus Helarchaeota archaeon]
MSKEKKNDTREKEGKDGKEYKVDRTDLEILKILEEDSKTNYREIGKQIGIAVGTVHNRISNLKEKGVIKKFTIDIDTEKIGYQITAIILLQILGESIQEIENELSKNPHVYGIYDTTGDWDSIIAVKFKHISELNNFLKSLNKKFQIKRTSTSVCLNVIKENAFFPILL